MSIDRTPKFGEVYRDDDGSIWLFFAEGDRHRRGYVSARPPCELEWRFYVVSPDGVAGTVCHPADKPLPEKLELVLDAGARQRAEKAEGEATQAKRERAALVVALRRAVGVVPVAVANELRAAYRQAVTS